jgi:ABC-type multidrug transport system fused ATPase/permease subunit
MSLKKSMYQAKQLLLKSDRKKLMLLLLPMAFSSLINIFGIALVMPFVGVASNPHLIQMSQQLSFLYHFFSFTSSTHFIVFLGVVALIMLVLTDSAAALTTWLSARVVEKVRARIAQTLYEKYLDSPYEFHLSNNSATLSNNLFSLVSQFTRDYVLQGIQLLSGSLSIVAILGFIIYLNPFLALMTALSLGGVYVVIYFSVKKTLDLNSKTMTKSSEAAYRLVNESFGGIKDIKLKGSEAVFKALFFPRLLDQARCNAAIQCISTLPKYALEIVAFGGIILLMLVMILSGQNTATIIPIISAYVYAGYRLMPAMQQLFAGVSSFKMAVSPLNAIYSSIADYEPRVSREVKKEEVVKFEKLFEIKNLFYRYTGYDQLVLEGISFSVKHKEIIGIIGSTGAGKTTLVDIILGLLKPTAGILSVDGLDLDSEIKIAAWQKSMGYVPQFIFLSDSTIRENIAFGENPHEIDFARIEYASKVAAIHDFITDELPNGYETVVGERGVKLSGGQIQRIGIARALYRNPSILVLDEATSSLDSQTEAEVMQAIYKMKDKITIIIIAHRLSTVACCDKVFLMKKGKVIDEGRFSELAKRHDFLKQKATEVVEKCESV